MPEETINSRRFDANELMELSEPTIIETFVCGGCGQNALSTDASAVNGEKICDNCFVHRTLKCTSCDDRYLINRMTNTSDGLVCATCLSTFYFVCADCGDIEHKDTRTVISGRGICDECYDDNYTNCGSCGLTIHYDDTYGDDNNYCESCYDDGEDTHNDIDCGELKRHPKAHTLVLAKWAKNQKLNTFGIELETQSSFPTTDNFTRTTDGRFKVVKDFTKHANSFNAKIDKDCGYHLHLGNYNNTYMNFKKVWLGYTILENVFYSMVSQSRRRNQYCRRFSADYTLNSILSKNNYARLLSHYYESFIKTKRAAPHNEYNEKRYYYVNLHVWLSRGTVEFRLHSGTMNYTKIMNWLLINKKLMDYLTNKKTTVANVMDLTPEKFYKLIGVELTKYVKNRHEVHGVSDYSRVELNKLNNR